MSATALEIINLRQQLSVPSSRLFGACTFVLSKICASRAAGTSNTDVTHDHLSTFGLLLATRHYPLPRAAVPISFPSTTAGCCEVGFGEHFRRRIRTVPHTMASLMRGGLPLRIFFGQPIPQWPGGKGNAAHANYFCRGIQQAALFIHPRRFGDTGVHG